MRIYKQKIYNRSLEVETEWLKDDLYKYCYKHKYQIELDEDIKIEISEWFDGVLYSYTNKNNPYLFRNI